MSGPYPYARFTMPLVAAVDDTGTPRGGAKLYFYTTGTSQPQDTYADATLSTPNSNPVIADQSGTWPPIFLAQLQYKVALVTADDVLVWTQDPVAPFIPDADEEGSVGVIEITVDGNGNVPSPGVCGDLYVPFDCTITAAVLQADLPGSMNVDIWANAFVVNTPPTALNSITASDPPTLDASVSSYDSTLTGWTKELSAGTALRFNLVSIDTITRFTLSLVISRTISS